jgi:anti-sigma-K factor RskA
MTDERLLELLPAHALGVLDGEDRAYVTARIAADAEARRQLDAFEEVVGRIGLGADPVAPSATLRERVLRAVPAAPERAATAPSRRHEARPAGRALTWLATAAALAFAAGLLVTWLQRNDARRDAALQRARAETAESQVKETLADLERTRVLLAREQAFRNFAGRPDTRLVSLGGLPPAPRARGRVLFDPGTREGFLLASGLEPAPEGKAYQLWVIAAGAPIPAGVFQAEADGRAVFRLPDVAEVAKVKTFAVTVEPAAGVPAPTGPMVLAGAVS